MSLDITFTLSDRDLDRFKIIVQKARSNSNDDQSMAEIEKAAYKIVDVAMDSDIPDFISERLLQLKVLLDMMRDEEWRLSDHEKSQILSAISNFATSGTMKKSAWKLKTKIPMLTGKPGSPRSAMSCMRA